MDPSIIPFAICLLIVTSCLKLGTKLYYIAEIGSCSNEISFESEQLGYLLIEVNTELFPAIGVGIHKYFTFIFLKTKLTMLY